MSAYDISGLLSGILGNITSLLGVIQTHVKSYRHLAEILRQVLEKSLRIRSNILLLQPLMRLDGVHDDFLNQAINNFEQIDNHLAAIRDEMESRSTPRKFSAAPRWDADLTSIDQKLTELDRFLQIIGVIGSHVAERRVSADQSWDILVRIAADISELKAIVSSSESYCADVRAIDGAFGKVVQCKLCRDNASIRIGNKNPTDANVSLFVGIGFFEGRLGDQDFTKAASYLHTAYSSGKREASCYLGKLYYKGLGVERCYSTAVQFFLSGVKAGSSAAMNELSVCYHYG